MATIRLVIPEELSAGNEASASTRSVNTGELRLGLLDNSKSNADHLLAQLAERMKQEFKVASVVSRRKLRVSSPAAPSVIDALSSEADVVIGAMAD